MESLLEKARAITELVEASDEARVDVGDVTQRLAAVTAATVLVVGEGGRVQALAPHPAHPLREELAPGRDLPPAAREALGTIDRIEGNVRHEGILSLLRGTGPERQATVIPLRVASRRLGWLLLLRSHGGFDEKDLVLGEYAATILSLEARRPPPPAAEAREQQARDQVRAALAALSLSEAEAVWHILSELRGPEGVVVASRVADRVGITRSVIVNALRKLESATVIRSRSLGMKGTYIKVLNPLLLEELRRTRARR